MRRSRYYSLTFQCKLMKLSNLETAWLSLAGALVATTGLLLSINSSGGSNIVRVDSGARSQLAEASAALTSGGYKSGQVAFWTGSNTIAGNDGLTWNFINGALQINDRDKTYVYVLSESPLAIQSYKGTTFGGKVSIGGNGTSVRPEDEALTVYGGLKLINSRVKPSCMNTKRGSLWFTTGGNMSDGSTVPDKLEVCAMDLKGMPGWRRIY